MNSSLPLPTEHCCVSMAEAFKMGFVLMDPLGSTDFVLALRKVSEVTPQATMGNVLTGETYDPSQFSVSLGLTFCPWCGIAILPRASEDWIDEIDEF